MQTADLILKNAKVITMDSSQPGAETVAIGGDRILLVGGRDDVARAAGAGTKVIDCEGMTLVPGFNDAHCHFFSLLRKLLSIDLSPLSVKSILDIKKEIYRKAQQTPPGTWLQGTGFNEFYLAEKRCPNRWDLDEVSPDHPVVLAHRSLHACVLNSVALRLAGITRETAEPPGVLIDRDLDTGEPNGILFEMLGYIRERVMPPWSEVDLLKAVALADRHYLSMGITSFQDATVVNDLKRWQTIRRLKNDGKLKSRVSMMLGIEALDDFREAGLAYGSGDNQLRLGAVKLVPTETAGKLLPPQPELNRQALRAHQAGFQLAIHAIRETSVEAAIVALEYALNCLPRKDHRHRIEHCAECPPHLLEWLSRLGAVVVTQPPFLYYSGERYLATVPASAQPWLYRIKSLFDGGMVVVGSSDAPVVPDSPLMGIYAAVTRRAESGQYLLPHEAVPAEQALAMYTINAAFASFEEKSKGSISPGKLADMVLLNGDPLTCSPDEIKDIRVEMTIIGGEVTWEA